MLAVLTKIKVKKNQFSIVYAGQTIKGVVSKTKRKRNGIAHKPTKTNKLSSIKIGHEVIVNNLFDYIKTSPIKKIIKCTQKVLTFETETSIYKLEVIK